MRRQLVIATLTAFAAFAASVRAQDPGVSVVDFDKKKGGSQKIHELGHVVAHDGAWKAAAVELQQARNRRHGSLCGFVNFDFTIYDLSNPSAAKQLFRWQIDNPEL